MEKKVVKKGQYWKLVNDSDWIVEVVEFLEREELYIEVLAKFWYPTSGGELMLVGPPKPMKIPMTDFHHWKLVNIEKEMDNILDSLDIF